TLTFNGQTTAAIPYDATAAMIQAALEALPGIGADLLGGLNTEIYTYNSSLGSLGAVGTFGSNYATRSTGNVPKIDYNDTSGPLWLGGPTERFAIRFTGTISIPRPGT